MLQCSHSQTTKQADARRDHHGILQKHHQSEELESTIETLKSYRQALSERYNYLETAATVPVVRLKRRRDYSSNKVFYDLILSIRFVDCGKDGKDVEQERTTYPGTERSKAIKDYRAYVKSHPGIIAYLDIEKSKWE